MYREVHIRVTREIDDIVADGILTPVKNLVLKKEDEKEFKPDLSLVWVENFQHAIAKQKANRASARPKNLRDLRGSCAARA